MRRVIFLLASALLLVAFLQRDDVASRVDGAVTVAPALRANSAATGKWVDLANYQGAMAIIVTGAVDNAGGTIAYAVLEDSSAGVAVGRVDSLALDSVDNKYYQIAYRGIGRWLRVRQSASAAADSITSGALILRSGKRKR